MSTSQADQVSALEECIYSGLVEEKDLEFCRSLCQKFHKYSGATSKQMYWISKMRDRALGLEEDVKPEKVNLGSFEGVVELFHKAKSNGLKYPKINLDLDGNPIQLSLAGPKSKKSGYVNITDGGSYGNNKWYGRISPNGNWTKSNDVVTIEKALTALLRNLSKNPHAVATTHGKFTGSCCFCNSKLTDKKSTTVGYGPVCSQKWSLYEQWKAAAKT